MRYLILALLLVVGVPAEAAWREASSKHFVIYSQQSAKSLEEFATRLERYDAAMRAMRGLSDPEISPGNRLTVFVVSSVGRVENLFGKGGANVAGFYIGRATGSIAITPQGEGDSPYDLNGQVVLFHEYAHHFMLANFPGAVPAWLIEGFAEFYSTARFDRDGSVGLGLPASHRAYDLIYGKALGIEKLLTASVGDLKPAEREQIYSRGWLLTHYLTFEPSRKDQLRSYLAEINRGTPGLEAAKKAFGDLAQLDRDLDHYLKQKELFYYKLTPDKIHIGPVAIRDLRPGEAAIMDVRIRSKRGVDEAAAKALVPLARKAALPYPAEPLAQVTLAEAEHDAGNFAESQAAAERALAADPKYVEALIYKGRALMGAALAAKKSDAATWKEVRHWFIAANRLEPEDPEPLMLFYTSFLAAKEKPPAIAGHGLEYALQLAPQDAGVRWMVGREYLQEGRPAEARKALAPLAFDPHGGRLAEAAASIVAKIDSGGAKAALEAWEKLEEAPDTPAPA